MNYAILIPLLASFLITLFFLPAWIRRAKIAGLVGKDMHKYQETRVAEAGGITVIAGAVFGILIYVAFLTFQLGSTSNLINIFAFLTCLLITCFIGFTDDILGWKIGLSRRVRLFFVLFAAIPLMVINAGETSISAPFLNIIDLGLIYTFLIIPLGIVGASTTFNFLAGYNGLEARQGILLIGAIAIASYFTGSAWLSVILLCVMCSLIGFTLFNNFPAKVFPGDVLTYSIGAVIASAAILGNLEKFAVFVFIPNILEVFLKIRGKLKAESFATPRPNGEIDLKYNKIYGLEHAAIYLLKKIKGSAYESEVVWVINLFQLVIILGGFYIFRKGIFLA